MTALQQLNTLEVSEFLERIGGPLEGQTWLAQRIVPLRPFASVDALFEAFQSVVNNATEAEKIALITSHPDLAGKASIDGSLSETSQREQAAAGLDRLSSAEFEAFHRLNGAYKEKFGFPFVICARENTKHTILAAFEARQIHPREQEIEIGIQEVMKILRLRLIDKFE